MKKLLLILVGVALVVGVLATAGYVYAQNEDNPDAEDATWPGFKRGRGGFWFGFGDGGILGEYMFPAIAEAFGFSDDQVEAFEKVKETISGIKSELSIEEVQEKMDAAFESALGAAVNDGAITQEEADQMLERREFFGGRGFMGRRGVGRGFPLLGREGGLLHDYVEAALAEALDVSVEELQSMKNDGLNLRDYAEEQGMTEEELRDMMVEIHTNAINAALADEVITKTQAEWLLDHVENVGIRLPFGPGVRGPRGGW